MIKHMEEADLYMETEIFTKESGLKVKLMDMDNINTQTELFIKVFEGMINSMVLETNNGLMVLDIKESI